MQTKFGKEIRTAAQVTTAPIEDLLVEKGGIEYNDARVNVQRLDASRACDFRNRAIAMLIIAKLITNIQANRIDNSPEASG